MNEYIDPDWYDELFLNDYYYFFLRLAASNDKYHFVKFDEFSVFQEWLKRSFIKSIPHLLLNFILLSILLFYTCTLCYKFLLKSPSLKIMITYK